MAEGVCFNDLNLRASHGTERGEKFGNVSSIQIKFIVGRQWIKAVRKTKRKQIVAC